MHANARECNVWICPAPERVVQVRVYWRQLAVTHLNGYCFSRASERSSYFGPSKRNSRFYLCGQNNGHTQVYEHEHEIVTLAWVENASVQFPHNIYATKALSSAWQGMISGQPLGASHFLSSRGATA